MFCPRCCPPWGPPTPPPWIRSTMWVPVFIPQHLPSGRSFLLQPANGSEALQQTQNQSWSSVWAGFYSHPLPGSQFPWNKQPVSLYSKSCRRTHLVKVYKHPDLSLLLPWRETFIRTSTSKNVGFLHFLHLSSCGGGQGSEVRYTAHL